MSRNQEQIDADEALTVAIEAAARAYGVIDPNAVILEYVVLASTQQITDEGEISYGTAQVFRDGSASGSRILGLLEMAAFDLKSRPGNLA